jgi:hypothetical protein
MANSFSQVGPTIRFGGPSGKSLALIKGNLTIDTTATAGAATTDFPASLFGLKSVVGCSNVIADDNSVVYPAAPSEDWTSLMIGGGTSLAATDLAADTYSLSVFGTK